MKKTLTLLFLTAMIAACKKEKTSISPSADFTFGSQTSDGYRLVANDTVTLNNSVKNAASISWDLGDGRKSTENKPVLSYPKAGVYTVTLTATSKDGQKVTASKKVTILNLVLKSIVINNVFWNNTDNQYADAGWPLTNSADIYVKIQKLQGNDVFLNGFVPNAPVIYSSPLQKDVAKVTNDPKTINVSSEVILDKAALVKGSYVISLIAKNTTGEYVLFSNLYGGSELLVKNDDLSKNTFRLTTSFFSSVDLNCDFE